MDSGAGDRGVSEVMGFILVFGMLVIAFTVYQGIIVPDQNRQVEFKHNQEVQGQLQDLRNAIVTTAATGTGQAVSVTLGASYPRRALAQNLGVSGGSLQTTDANDPSLRLHNAQATDDEVADYLDGSQRRFETASILYTPVYTFYSSAPQTVYENSLLYNQFGTANLTLTDQVIVDGRRITLIAVNGTLERSERDTVSISTEAISASSNRIAVTNTTDERINVTIPTRLSATKWEEVLAEEMGSEGYVEGVHAVPGEDAVNVSLEQGVAYELRMAKVGVGSATSDEGAEYVTAVQGDGVSIAEGGSQKLVVEVRDRFNNPVSNVSVDASITQSAGAGDGVSPSSATTDSDGEATFTYDAPDDVAGAQVATVNATFGGGGDEKSTASLDVAVLDSDGSGGGGGGGGGGTGTNQINPAQADDIVLVDANTAGGGGNSPIVDVEFDNTGSSSVNFTRFRVSFGYVQNGNHPSEVVEISDPSGSPIYQSSSRDIGSNIESFDTNELEIPASGYTVRFEFDENMKQSFFIVTFETDGGDLNTYFVSVP